MDNIALIDSFSEFKDFKHIDRTTLMVILEDVFRNALKKRFGTDDNFDIIINPDKGDMEIWRNRIVVDNGEVEDENLEISLNDARKIEPDFEVGEEVSQEFKLIELGRRAILALRQNLITKIHEHDSTNLYKQFKDLINEVYSAEVHHVRPKAVILVDDNNNEIVLPKEKQIPSDYFKKGDTVRGVIEAVELKGSKPQIIMSRTSELFLEKLFEQEIPEIAEGIILIKKVVRIPGEKAKVAVDSYNENIDAVGACVGVKGSRIHGIVRELGNENIDVIHYTSNPTLLISRSLSPAEVNEVKIDEEKNTATVLVNVDEVSKAIGRNGQNIKLAGQLTGYIIDVIRQDSQEVDEDDVEITEFTDEIDEWVINEFKNIGLDTAKSVLRHTVEELVRRTDLEEETVIEVLNIFKAEFEDQE
jgi:transcription termination/antitermination protein NusA